MGSREKVKFAKLEAVRGFAALYVCVGHIFKADSLGAAYTLLRFGQEAVMIFFVLSGFVICWTTEPDSQKKGQFRQYFWKRFARIYSVWFLAVLAMFVISAVEQKQIVLPSLGEFVGNFLMLQDFSYGKPNVICDPIYGDTPLWSLHYEWWFYMVFPLILLIKEARSRVHWVGVTAIFASVCYVMFPNPVCRLLIYLSVWYVGAHAAICLREEGRVNLKNLFYPLMYVLLASLPLIAAAYNSLKESSHIQWGLHPVLEARHLVSSIVFVVLAFAWRSLKWIGFSHSIGLFSVAAPISFSLYVIHFRSMATATYLSFVNSRAIETIGYITVTVVFCYLAELVFYPWIRGRFSSVKLPNATIGAST